MKIIQFFLFRNADLDDMHCLCTCKLNENDILRKIKNVCFDDSIEEPFKKEVSKSTLILYTLNIVWSLTSRNKS